MQNCCLEQNYDQNILFNFLNYPSISIRRIHQIKIFLVPSILKKLFSYKFLPVRYCVCFLFFPNLSTRPIHATVESINEFTFILYSHSVVPGGLDVRSYRTREIPGTVLILLTILWTTSIGISFPGCAATPVIKSLVKKGRKTTER